VFPVSVQVQESCMSDELDPTLTRLLQDDDRPDLIGVTLKSFMKTSVIKLLTVFTAPCTSTALWTCRSLRSSKSFIVVGNCLFNSSEVLQLLLRRLKLLGRLLLFKSTVFVRILMYRPNHLVVRVSVLGNKSRGRIHAETEINSCVRVDVRFN
jgi:hypothetical protein